MRNKKIFLYQIILLIILIALWEVSVHGSSKSQFLYGSPSKISSILWEGLANRSLIYDSFITLSETLIGFILGNTIGVIIGLGLWYSKTVFKVAKPYIIVLGSIPIVALAPLMIIWFGTGILSKVILVALATSVLALVQSYKGAEEVEADRIKLLKTFGATKNQIFSKVVVPSSLTWVVSALKLNIGVALLGAFIGEFISSTHGLGHYIIVASGLYDISSVFVGVLLIAFIALVLTYLMDLSEKLIMPWKHLKKD